MTTTTESRSPEASAPLISVRDLSVSYDVARTGKRRERNCDQRRGFDDQHDASSERGARSQPNRDQKNCRQRHGNSCQQPLDRRVDANRVEDDFGLLKRRGDIDVGNRQADRHFLQSRR